MKTTNIVHLGSVREALAELERARLAILAGAQDGFHIAVRCDGVETIFLGGMFLKDQGAATRAVLKASAARMLAEDDPPPMLRSSRL